MKSKLLSLISILFIFVVTIFPNGFFIDEVKAKGPSSRSQSTSLNSSKQQTLTFNLPHVTRINSINVDDGKVVSQKLNGNTLTVVVDGSGIDHEEWDEKYYSKSISNYGSPNKNSSDTYSYNTDGYKGTLNKYVVSGEDTKSKTVTKTETKTTNSFNNTISYSSDGFTGTLSKKGSSRKIQTGGSYTPSDTKWVSNQTSSYYNSGGYTGTLSGYLVGDPPRSKTAYDSNMYTTRSLCDAAPNSLWYSSGGYSGNIYKDYCALEPDINRYIAWYSGTVWTPDNRYTRYQGNVTKPASDTRTYKYEQDYSGTVKTKDTRVWKYKGTVYKGKWINQKYRYNVTVTYEDNRKPSVTLTTNNDSYSEVNGYNNIKVEGKVTDPDGDGVTLYYSIANKSGTIKVGNNQNYTLNIPVDSQIPEGTHQLSIYVDDGDYLGKSSTVSKTIIVDKTRPNGKLEIIDKKAYDVTMEFKNVNGDISGLHSTPYMIERAEGVNGTFAPRFTWSNLKTVNDSNVESNTKYSYRGNIRDKVGHSYSTNIVEYLSSPKIMEKDKFYKDDEPNTIILELEKELPEGVWLEIKRSGTLIATMKSGKTFIDKGLDFERDYKYEFKAITTDQKGERLESLPINITVTTGVSTLILKLEHEFDSIDDSYKVYRTVFDDLTIIKGSVFYKQGGEIGLSYEDKNGVIKEKINLPPYTTKPFTLNNHYLPNSQSKIRAELIGRGLSKEEVNIDVLVKNISVREIPKVNNKLYDFLYNR